MAEFGSGMFSRPAAGTRHLYGQEGVTGHRRTLSNNTENYQAFKSNRGHRRTMSNSTVDFQRILATSPTAEKPLPEPKPQTPDSLAEEEHKPSVSARKKKRAFQGMLDAAITYFSEKQATYVPALAPSTDSADAEVSDMRGELKSLEDNIKEMEVRNEELRAENQALTAQRETFALTIGSLNTKILDLQLLLDERSEKKTNSEPVKRLPKPVEPLGSVAAFHDDSGSLDISEIKSESIQKPKAREETRRPSGDVKSNASSRAQRQGGRTKAPISFS